MLIDDILSIQCEVGDVVGVPSPGTSATPEPVAIDHGVVLRFVSAPDSGSRKVDVSFEDCLAVSLGPPNDEALCGHQLWGKGLRSYTFQEVLGSDWIADIRRRNRVHHGHSDELSARYRNFIVTFQDKTFECVAGGFTIASTEQGAER